MQTIKPEWNEQWKRWEVPDEETGNMRGLSHTDLMDMADLVIIKKGWNPELNEESVDRELAKLEKKYGIKAPLPIWAAKFLDEYEKARDVCAKSMYRMRYILLEESAYRLKMHRIRYMDFAQTGIMIRDARKQAGLTQAELARRLGMSRATISQLENGVIGDLGIRKLVCNTPEGWSAAQPSNSISS